MEDLGENADVKASKMLPDADHGGCNQIEEELLPMTSTQAEKWHDMQEMLKAQCKKEGQHAIDHPGTLTHDTGNKTASPEFSFVEDGE